MKTLIFFGSPRPNGDTAFLVDTLCGHLPGEITLVNAYQAKISPCRDCRFCTTKTNCVLSDEMTKIYQKIIESDLIVLASPVYFGELTGPLLSLLSRLQIYFYARFKRKEHPIPDGKKGIILLAGGGSGSPDRAVATAKDIFRCINVAQILPPVIAGQTDTVPARKDEKASESLRQMIGELGKDSGSSFSSC